MKAAITQFFVSLFFKEKILMDLYYISRQAQ